MTDEKDGGPFSGADGEATRISLSGDKAAGNSHFGDERTRLGQDPDSTRLNTIPDDLDRTQISGGGASAAPGEERSKIGFVLNNIWKVRRLIAEGGMGEVYEGIETNTGDRVAIKFLLPRLTADPKVKELFLSEARNFVRLSKAHPALVQYRVCAEEPQLREIFIVMEYIDGPPLAETLSTLKPDLHQLVGFMRLVASALAVAHQSRLIHRDLSPKNILLPGGELDRAKIIDFGIAKDLAAGEATIFGGFKGNLGYCAPEQFNEGAGPESSGVGPWTDVYSLGLVVLAAAIGKSPGMGTSLAEAIERRKKVPDLSGVPKELRALLAQMLAPDPTKRLQSMPDVLAGLDKIAPTAPKQSRLPMMLAAASIVLLIAFGAVYEFFLRGPGDDEIRQRIGTTIAATDCSWLNLDSVARPNGEVRAKISGVAGNVARAAATAQQAAGFPVSFDTTEVSTVQREACGPLNAFRRMREAATPAGPSLVAQQRQFRLGNDPRFCGQEPLKRARVTVNLRLEEPSTDFTLLGLEPNGQMQQLIADRKDFEAARAQSHDFAPNLGGNIYTLSFCVDETTAARSAQGLIGLVLVKGMGPFSLGFDPNAKDSAPVPADWSGRFVNQAMAQHWVTQIAWYHVVSQ
ncbi:MAG TPA: serine/threonine-protein kinase [Micropepsaceae bacterium]|jgi:serine/threonine-protein kinase|nr:serine/threonine-protein kinase [Micropepsaceae bacterium]